MKPIRTELAYSFTPPDFFEARTTITLESGQAVFDAGKVLLTLAKPMSVDHDNVQAFTSEIQGVLRTRQILTGGAFKLVGPRITHHDAQGHQHHVMLAETGRFNLRGFPVDFRVTDAAGNVIQDTKAERIRDHTAFVNTIASKASGSPTLLGMLESYGHSLEDPTNALVHLYEIRDAAVVYFGGDSKARQRLNMTRDDWSTLGRLANHEPVKEGRHRGQHASLRPTTENELNCARTIARALIESCARLV